MTERLTRAGHDPAAVSILSTILARHVDDPFRVAADVFADLHDSGLRVVALELVGKRA